MKEGIILAAGIGSRLNTGANLSIAKPLASVDSLALLLRTIHSLELAECTNVLIVLGYQADSIKKFVTANHSGSAVIKFVENENYKLKNGVSVLCARPFVGKEYILTMADHILDDKIMLQLVNHKPPDGGATLCVDYKINSVFDLEDATKVLTDGALIKQISKEITQYNCIDTGVFIGTDGLMNAIDQIYKQEGDASLSEGVQLLADEGLMETLDIKDAYWQDVDTPEMLKHAEALLSNHSETNFKSETNEERFLRES